MPRIELVQGDITQENVDAIVNAANKALAGGGGVDGAIHRAGGPSILEECRRIIEDLPGHELPVGQAVATGAGHLPARWVIHTVGPVYGVPQAEELLRSCHIESLRVADELGARTVALRQREQPKPVAARARRGMARGSAFSGRADAVVSAVAPLCLLLSAGRGFKAM